MSRKIAIDILANKGEVLLTCNGNSMRPLMKPGDSLRIKKVKTNKLRVGDPVFCKVNGGLQVHRVNAIDETKCRYQISNAKGFINGWIGSSNIYGLCVQAEDRIIVSDDELDRR